MAIEDMAFWLSWCIEEYAASKKMSLLMWLFFLKKRVHFSISLIMLKYCIRKVKTTF